MLMVSQLESFKDDPSENLRDYLNKVSVTPWFDPIVNLNSKVAPAVRKDSSGIFLALVTPHLPGSASTLARWLSAYLAMGGVDNSKSKKHYARAATTAFLKNEKSLFMKEICDLACWVFCFWHLQVIFHQGQIYVISENSRGLFS